MGLKLDPGINEYLINHYIEQLAEMRRLLMAPDLTYDQMSEIRNALKCAHQDYAAFVRKTLEDRGFGVPAFEAGKQYILHNEDLDETIAAKFERTIDAFNNPDAKAYLFRKELDWDIELDPLKYNASSLVLISDEEFLRGNVYLYPDAGA
jgi:hypothetical protein